MVFRISLESNSLQDNEHTFRYCFQDTLNPQRNCVKDIELKTHLFLHSTNFLMPRKTLSQKIKNGDVNILCQSEKQLNQAVLYSNQKYHSSIKSFIINLAIKYLISNKRFKFSILVKVFCKKGCVRNVF